MKRTIWIAVSLLIAGAFLFSAYEDGSAEAEPKYFDDAKVVRVKFVEGEAFVQRSYEEGNEEATVNLPIFEKDAVGTTDGRLEIYLGRLNYMRLDFDTMIRMERIPNLRRTDMTVRIEKGGVIVDAEEMDNERDVEIQTPDCGIFLLDKGVYRVNVMEGGETEVYVLEGSAEVSGEESSRNVRENQKIVMSRGQLKERPYYFYASEKDDFDRWNDQRNSSLGYARYGSSHYLQSGYDDYEYELSRAGRWSYRSDFGCYGWVPYSIGSDWRPYWNGRWIWNPHYGYVWNSYDSWGWFTHHYGRWHWDPYEGWYWLPGYHWSPAWVSWFWDDDYWCWSPLSWWNRPVIIINNHWDHHYDYRRGIPGNCRSTIVIRKHELSASHINRVALQRDALAQVGNRKIVFRGTSPAERMAEGKVPVINAAGKTVIYRQGGIVSTDKYRPTTGEGGAKAVIRYSGSSSRSDSVRKYSGTASRDSSEKAVLRKYSSRAGSGGSESTGKTSEASGEAKAKKKTESDGSSGYRSKSSESSSSGTSGSSQSGTSSSGKAVKKKNDDDPGRNLSSYSARGAAEGSTYRSYATTVENNSQARSRIASAEANGNKRYRSFASGQIGNVETSWKPADYTAHGWKYLGSYSAEGTSTRSYIPRLRTTPSAESDSGYSWPPVRGSGDIASRTVVSKADRDYSVGSGSRATSSSSRSSSSSSRSSSGSRSISRSSSSSSSHSSSTSSSSSGKAVKKRG